MSCRVFLTSSLIFLMTSTATESPAAFLSMHCCQRLPFDDFLGFLVIFLLGVVDLSVLVFFFGGKATFSSSRFMISTSRAELRSFFITQASFPRSVLQDVTSQNISIGGRFLNWIEQSLNLLQDTLLLYLSLCL